MIVTRLILVSLCLATVSAQWKFHKAEQVHEVKGTKFTCSYKIRYMGSIEIDQTKSSVKCLPNNKKKGEVIADLEIGGKAVQVEHVIKKGADTISAIKIAAPPTTPPVPTTRPVPMTSGGPGGPGGPNGTMNCQCRLPPMENQVMTGRRKRSAPSDRQLFNPFGGLTGTNNNGLTDGIMEMVLNEMMNNPEMMSNMMTQMVESGAMEQMVQQMVASGAMEDMAKEMVSSGAIEQLVQEMVASGVFEETIKEAIDSGATEQIIQQLVESGVLEQALQELMESGALEKVIEEFMMSGKLEEALNGMDMESMLMEWMQENNGSYSEEEFMAYIEGLMNDIDPEVLSAIMEMFAEMEVEMVCNCV